MVVGPPFWSAVLKLDCLRVSSHVHLRHIMLHHDVSGPCIFSLLPLHWKWSQIFRKSGTCIPHVLWVRNPHEMVGWRKPLPWCCMVPLRYVCMATIRSWTMRHFWMKRSAMTCKSFLEWATCTGQKLRQFMTLTRNDICAEEPGSGSVTLMIQHYLPREILSVLTCSFVMDPSSSSFAFGHVYTGLRLVRYFFLCYKIL